MFWHYFYSLETKHCINIIVKRIIKRIKTPAPLIYGEVKKLEILFIVAAMPLKNNRRYVTKNKKGRHGY
jgi:hypothetical protein